MDLEPVAGEAADADDVVPEEVRAAAPDRDGLTVADGAGEFPPPQVDGIGVAGGDHAEQAGEEVPQVCVGDLPGHGDVLGHYRERAGQLVGHADSGVAEPDGGDDSVGGLQGGPPAGDDEVGGVVLVAEDPLVALVLAALPGAGHLGEAEPGPDGRQVLAQGRDVAGSLDDEVDVLADASVRSQVHAEHGGAEDPDGVCPEQACELGVQAGPGGAREGAGLLGGRGARVEVLADPGLGEHDVGAEGVAGQFVVLGVVLAVGRAAEQPVAAGVG